MTPTATKLEQWKGRKLHTDLTLPSGTKVDIEVPNLPELLRSGGVPNELVKYAADAAEALQDVSEKFDMEKIKEATDFVRWLVSATVKNPEVQPEDVPNLPAEDVDKIVEWALRYDDRDAIGKHLAGLEKLPEWRKFRIDRLGA